MFFFPGIFYKGHNFCNFMFAFLHTKSLLKEVYTKKKTFASKGNKFFHFKVDPFSEGRQNNLDRVITPENDSVHLEMVNIIG